MTELEERLRRELTRSVAAVRPAPDPLRRLLTRRRRRRRATAGTLAFFVVLALTGGALTTAAGQLPDPAPFPGPTEPTRGPIVDEVITSDWTRQLLAGPTRGNLAGDAALVGDLARELARSRAAWNVDPALDKVKVLLLADVAGARMFGMSYYNDERAVYVTSSGPSGSTATDLAGGRFGGGVSGLLPFFVQNGGAELTGLPAYYFVAALAPPGCEIATSTEARLAKDGTVTRTWVDQGDYVVRPGKGVTMMWRVTCGGVVRDIQAAPEEMASASLGGPPVPERGQAEPSLVTAALASWRTSAGLPVTRYRVLWGGSPDGVAGPVVVMLGETSGGGVQVCAYSGKPGRFTVLSTAVAHRSLDTMALPSDPAYAPDGAVTTGVAGSADLVAIRLPDAANPYLLSDRLLVIAPAAATAVRVTGGEQGEVSLVGGVGMVTARLPAELTLRAVDATGTALAQSRYVEPDADGLLFGQPLISRWR